MASVDNQHAQRTVYEEWRESCETAYNRARYAFLNPVESGTYAVAITCFAVGATAVYSYSLANWAWSSTVEYIGSAYTALNNYLMRANFLKRREMAQELNRLYDQGKDFWNLPGITKEGISLFEALCEQLTKQHFEWDNPATSVSSDKRITITFKAGDRVLATHYVFPTLDASRAIESIREVVKNIANCNESLKNDVSQLDNIDLTLENNLKGTSLLPERYSRDSVILQIKADQLVVQERSTVSIGYIDFCK